MNGFNKNYETRKANMFISSEDLIYEYSKIFEETLRKINKVEKSNNMNNDITEDEKKEIELCKNTIRETIIAIWSVPKC